LVLLHAGDYRNKTDGAPCTDTPRDPLESGISMQAGAAIAKFCTDEPAK